ncbi:hypothetical protein COY51_01015 [Candidatus Desantisbacteria bacterium CG_4_10_14_0_8_um_filter_39_17]|uniref:MrpA C-terminal/MbhE domain-containing protein n=1 Tax=Candidatus Desantisbacteria bacterium CG_4_10_14_0_8_um_filter_39_17 TaxID=1974542 RepID=A0A2H9PCS5_9BACT|nr:MAG: hypothetical protein COY51_01015 [Candidatus Desantisbacteria bacterium CG_4_10_14_0_8_um_filter_39_17]
MSNELNKLIPVLILTILGLFVLNGINFEFGKPPPGVSEHYITQGVKETGAINLVTAVYLGYRAYDTLGEAVVLFASIAGVIYLLKRN